MNQLPEGYTAAPVVESDIARIVDLNSAGRNAAHCSAFEFLSVLQGFDLASATQLVSSSDEGAAAFAEVLRMDEPYPRVWMRCVVHPDHRGSGIGSALYGWMREHALASGDEACVYLEQSVPEGDAGSIAFLKNRGFEYVRKYTRMVRNLTRGPVSHELPPGFSVSAIGETEVDEGALRESVDILREHFGNTPQPDDNELVFSSHLALKEPRFDPPSYYVARNGKEVGGICSCYPEARGDSSIACIPIIVVRRVWRGNGLGAGLLLYAFNQLAEAGVGSVELQVDAAHSPALAGLCERVGMQAAGDVLVYRRANEPIPMSASIRRSEPDRRKG